MADLPNRRSFVECLERLISRAERYGNRTAMLFVDVNGLKAVNDRFGHTAGDEALVQVAQMLVDSVRKGDCVARLVGDEFGILLENADELSAWRMALRAVETVVGSQFCVDGKCLPLSIAVGVGVIESGDDPQTVIVESRHEGQRFCCSRRSVV